MLISSLKTQVEEGRILSDFISSKAYEIIFKIIEDNVAYLNQQLLVCKIEDVPEIRGKLQAFSSIIGEINDIIQRGKEAEEQLRKMEEEEQNV